MSYKVEGTKITLTRGDTLRVKMVPLMHGTSNVPYIPVPGDAIRFAMKKTYDEEEPLLVMSDIPISTCILHVAPEQTKNIDYGSYVYDVQLTYANGDIDTYIKGTLTLTEEVE